MSMDLAKPRGARVLSHRSARLAARRLGPARTWTALTAIVAGVLLAACAPARAVTGEVAEALISVEEERQLGDQVAAELEAQVELLDDTEVQNYVQNLGDRLLANAPDAPEGMAYRFQVIDAPDQINAVALPGGYVYVFSGLILAAEDEAELAGVLAHELAHVTQRHIAEQLVAQLGLELLLQMALGQDPGVVRQLATLVAAQGAFTSFSREAEREADYHGVLYLARAGWAPESYARFFDKLAEAGEAPAVLAFLQTHPAPSERADNARQLIAQMTRVPTFTGDARYRQVVERVEAQAALAPVERAVRAEVSPRETGARPPERLTTPRR
jgi:beta-barrel assembly-enhancing protease